MTVDKWTEKVLRVEIEIGAGFHLRSRVYSRDPVGEESPNSFRYASLTTYN